ncbi:EAL domain-containing protein [Desulfurobacterium thermolithotrophum]|uniref:EAL domain-containing protein n=1 Tax=Desulfurobacterium thermolithotrophum TaxID=64160 RepID=UPI0013D616F8|nr:GGDEF domain-containing phosphodiesterase [Desulfurobacterium thermolithotrophum]
MVDEITGLFSRKAFFNLLGKKSNDNREIIIVIFDIDDFKFVNLSYGYDVGDSILKACGNRIKEIFQTYFSEIFIARTDSNEFSIALFDDIPLIRIKEIFYKHINRMIFKKRNELIAITVSAGTSKGKHPLEVFSKAENSLFLAKESGKNTIFIDEKSRIRDFQKMKDIRKKLIEAIRDNGVKPYFQPIVSLRTGEIFGYEVLARIFYKNELLKGDYVFSIADTFSLTPEIDKQLFLKAIKYLNKEYKLFFNISMKYFVKELNNIFQIAKTYSINLENITLEITESQKLIQEEVAKSIFRMFKEFHVGIAVDDFGAGYSNFVYLKKFPVDVLKIDGDFIKNAKKDVKDLAIAKSIVDVGRAFRLRTLAEFIEDEETYRIMKDIGVSLGQGWFIGKPAPEPQKVKINLN